MSRLVCGNAGIGQFGYMGDFPVLEEVQACCWDAANDGGAACTCWEPVYAPTDQFPPQLDAVADIGPEGGCVDCAYRADSPEKRGDENAAASAADLERLVAAGQPFWCHQGMRRPIKYVHPTGAEFVPPGIEHAYAPPIVASRPYKADGSPADLCGGWVARRLHFLASPRGDNDG